jgi:ubiquinone/menaquinone biosynthesis C-methylase UbiE
MTMPRGPLAEPLPWNLVARDYAIEVVPQFEKFAADALRLAELRPAARVLDVAAGPGTLALLAATSAHSVAALDFSSDMITLLEQRARQAGVVNVTARVGDGQALPYADGSFDAAFSMFGLIFFPDRMQGLKELKRVLSPGGVAVVSSWRPFSEAPLLAAVMGALAEQLPDLPFGKSKAPMGEEAEVLSEMTAAGFHDVRVERVAHASDAPDMATFWGSLERTMAPLVLLRNKMGQAWLPVGARIFASLAARFGTGPQSVSMPALLGIGRA